MRTWALALGLLVSTSAELAGADPTLEAPPALSGVHRVVFVGDSITYSGQYIEFVEALLRVTYPGLSCEFLDLGLPSETVSGLSEPGHAGGAFPRPDLHERFERILAQTKPDLVVACYGMNDGIYAPYTDERAAAYKSGVKYIRDRAKSAGAKVLHLTPPVFDSVPIKDRTLPAGLAEYRQPFEGYDEVLDKYAAWLVSRKTAGWDVIDIHGPMRRFLDEQRGRDPKFHLAGDGVHINATGQWIIARELLRHWGFPAKDLETTDPARALARRPNGPEVLKLVQKRQGLLKDAWLNSVGHKRPGMTKGIPLDEALRKAGEIDGEIRKRLETKP